MPSSPSPSPSQLPSANEETVESDEGSPSMKAERTPRAHHLPELKRSTASLRHQYRSPLPTPSLFALPPQLSVSEVQKSSGLSTPQVQSSPSPPSGSQGQSHLSVSNDHLSISSTPEPETSTTAVDVGAILVNDLTVEDEEPPPPSTGEPLASSQQLRDQLRRSLSMKGSQTLPAKLQRPKHPGMEDLSVSSSIPGVTALPLIKRQFFILTHAGKPVFISNAPDERRAVSQAATDGANAETADGAEKEKSTADYTSAIGVMQALISVFADEGDKIRTINAHPIRMTFILRTPLYYVCVSDQREPESITRTYLEYLHLQILSVVTSTQLQRIFERSSGFDLRRLLEGTETFLHTLIYRLPKDLAVMTSSLHSLRMDPALRTRAAEALVPAIKNNDMLYAILVAADKVVTLVRPRKHSIHPADLHILLSTIASPSLASTPASWLPICLPKFNSKGFLYAFASFLRPQAGIVLVLVSASGEFEPVKKWSDACVKSLEADGTLDGLSRAARSHDYSVDELSIPGLRHFVYKSRRQVQITTPKWEDEYADPLGRERLMNLYHKVHDAIHAKSGQECTLKLQYIKTDKEAVMGWITQPFEIYICLSPRLPKSAAVNAANAVIRWVKKEENKLILRDAPVF